MKIALRKYIISIVAIQGWVKFPLGGIPREKLGFTIWSDSRGNSKGWMKEWLIIS